MYKNKKIGLVIPARNEQKLIKPTLERVPKDIIDKVYVINDGSTDDTSESVNEITNKDKRIILLVNDKNIGPGGAIIRGYKEAVKDGMEIVVVIGGDNQMPIEEVRSFLDPIIDEGYDYTKGNRFLVEENVFEDMPLIRQFGNSVISLLTKVASGYYKIFDFVEGYTAITKRAIDTINWNKAWPKYGYPMDFLIRLNCYGFRVKDIPRKAIYLPGERQSQIKGFTYALKVSPMLLRGFIWRLTKKYIFRDFHPLIFCYFGGFLFTASGLLWGLHLINKQVVGLGVSGPQAMLCALLIIVGLQSLLFGMLFDMMESDR
ncbi:MAG: glycosyltransferase family 2 protein [Elusimicrobia bacterium]|nr:glycosyltransferase family 2 protein [Candidatus Liberimonas magnetica]